MNLEEARAAVKGLPGRVGEIEGFCQQLLLAAEATKGQLEEEEKSLLERIKRLRGEVLALEEKIGPLKDEVADLEIRLCPLRGEVAALRKMFKD